MSITGLPKANKPIITVEMAMPDTSKDIPRVFIIHTIIPPEFIASYILFYLIVLVLSIRILYRLHLVTVSTERLNCYPKLHLLSSNSHACSCDSSTNLGYLLLLIDFNKW